MVQAGVTVFKIEGRARSAEYVKRATQCYREAADAICDGVFTPELAAGLKERLSEVFNRGFWDGWYQGGKMAQWSEIYGSHATRRKTYFGKVTNWYDRISVAEVLVESGSVKVGDDFIAIGATTGVYEGKVEEIRVDLVPVQEARKGDLCSIPVAFPEDWKGDRKLRRGDRLYLWEEVGE